MARPDPALLNLARYPYRCRIEPRFADLDVNLHINNVATAALLEDGRVRFNHATGFRETVAATGATAMVASLAIEYLAQGRYPQPVDIHAALETVGRTSVGLVQLITQEDRVLTFARTVLVMVGADGPVPLPETFGAPAAAWMLRP